MWAKAAGDSNVAAQQEGLAALCAFLKYGSSQAGLRARQHAVNPIVEKCLTSTRAATKASALEALLLFIEIDVPGPIIDEILPALSHKQPKVIAASLAALTQIYHNYGCKTVDPKPVLKNLSKVFGHADKNVRAEATNLAVEFYRWLRDAMKPTFWNDLKPAQQNDLESQFEKIKAEKPPKQERLLRSQQAAQERAPADGDGEDGDGEEGGEADDAGEVDAFDLAEPQDVLAKIPKDFYDNLGSAKWKERKEALEALYAAVNVPRIKEDDYAEINRSLAKCMKDANIAVVTQAAQCIELLAKGLRKEYAKYRTIVMQPIMERLKEKKQSVADALGAALDAVFLSTDLTECLEDITAFLAHKNPQVKEGTMKFLVRCLRTTKDVPSKQQIGTMVESAKKLLAESSEALRSGGAEILGTIMKIIGERAMNPHIDGLDDIRKAKIKEFFDKAEVKAKDKPKPPPPAARGPPGAGGPKKAVGGGVKKPVKKPAGPPAPAEPTPAPAAAPPSRPGPASKLGMARPGGPGGLKAPQKRTLAAPAPGSPRAQATSPSPPPPMEDELPESPPPAKPPSRLGLGRGGLAARSLAKPAAPSAPAAPPSPTPPPSGLSPIERAELEELRTANEHLLRQLEDARHERSKLLSEIQELKNQNASLIEDHTRDVLSIKAKETQLVRARSDAEAAEQTNERLRRELERLKRALSKAEALNASLGAGSPGGRASPGLGFRTMSPTHDDLGIYRDSSHPANAGWNRMSFASTRSEEKENGDGWQSSRIKGSTTSSGRDTPPRNFRRDVSMDESRSNDGMGGAGYAGYNDMSRHRAGSRASYRSDAPSTTSQANAGMESWRRAAEVTSQLKARIEQMKVGDPFFWFPNPVRWPFLYNSC